MVPCRIACRRSPSAAVGGPTVAAEGEGAAVQVACRRTASAAVGSPMESAGVQGAGAMQDRLQRDSALPRFPMITSGLNIAVIIDCAISGLCFVLYGSNIFKTSNTVIITPTTMIPYPSITTPSVVPLLLSLLPIAARGGG